MRELAKIMIEKYSLEKLKYDFMGYYYNNIQELSLHHLIIPKEKCKKLLIPEGGYLEWNCVVLNHLSAHNYLHLIERIDRDVFDTVTSELIDENIKGYINYENLIYINDALNYFEREHCGSVNRKGEPIIKEEYTRRLLKRE